MTWLTYGATQVILLVTAAVVVTMLVTLVVQRALRHRRDRARAELDRVVRPIALAATVAEDDEIDALLTQVAELPADAQAQVRRTVFRMLRDVTGEAAQQLRRLGDAVGMVPRVLEAARDRRVAMRADAAEALGLLQPPQALDELLRLAGDPNPEVRTVAVRALGGFTDSLAIDMVTAALAHDSGVPNSIAASALLRQGLAAGDRVRRALDDPDHGVRHGAARVAGLLQVPGAAEALLRRLDDDHDSVRLAAIRSLELVPSRAAVEPLLEVALRGDDAAEAAAAVLASMPRGWTTEALARLAVEAMPGVRRAAGLPRREAVA